MKTATLDDVCAATGFEPDEVMDLVNSAGLPLPGPGMTWDLDQVNRWMLDTANDDHGIIYAAGFGEYVKIGFTKGSDARGRIATLQTSCPEKLTIYAEIKGPRCQEREIHRLFGRLQTAGEWFRKTPELMLYVAKLDDRP